MRKIKFRAKTFYGNEIVYGDLYHDNDCLMIRTDDGKDYLDYYIRPSSIAQFVGYDKNGKEIFSDDKIRVYSPQFPHITDHIAGDYFKISDIGKKFDNAELIEED